jgi:hypothetical protein
LSHIPLARLAVLLLRVGPGPMAKLQVLLFAGSLYLRCLHRTIKMAVQVNQGTYGSATFHTRVRSHVTLSAKGNEAVLCVQVTA